MTATRSLLRVLAVPLIALSAIAWPALAQAQNAKQPNIIMIMGDDIGWSNIGVYNQGIMAMRTPNLDRLAAEGMRFTDC
jgi:arylsulfatase